MRTANEFHRNQDSQMVRHRKIHDSVCIEIHLNLETLEARHCLTTDPLRYHDGFSEADSDAGWKQTSAVSGTGITQAEIEAMKAEAIASNRAFWLNLTVEHKGDGIIANGNHYVAHELGVGCGFYGRGFKVTWLDPMRPSMICNLSAQGTVPGWLRPHLPDNATITDLGYCLDQRPTLSRRRMKRYLKMAGLLPAQANEFLRNRDADRHYSHFDHWPSQALRDLMKRGKRHADKWFPSNAHIAD